MTDGVFLPTVSIHTPINGDTNNSMEADTDDKIDNIWIACDCGDLTLFIEAVLVLAKSVKCLVREGRGENATIEMDATIKKEV